MNRKLFLILPLIFLFMAMKPDKPAYKLFNHEGRQANYKKLLKKALEADVILFGEFHNNPICHWLQLELTKDLYKNKEQNLVLGAEMIEADDQEILNSYLNGTISLKEFKEKARLWNNYKTDYEPLVDFAKEKNLQFVAANIPRRYAAKVNKGGLGALDTLPENEKAFIAPLPIKYDPELEGYKSMLNMMKGMPHITENLPKAQAIKDATMAHFILENLGKNQLFLHYNGSYHSKNYEGIYWYLKQAKPQLKILTIASIEQEEIYKLEEENVGLANFILAIPKTMTKTY